MIAVLLSYALVAVCMYFSKFVFTTTVPVTIRVTDGEYFDGTLNEKHYCWINPDAGGSIAISNILAKYPDGCSFIGFGSVVNTYVGHQFAVIEQSKVVEYDATNPPKILTAQANLHTVDVNSMVEYDSQKHFDYLVEWQRLILQRKQIVTGVACVLFAIALLFNISPEDHIEKKINKANKKKTTNKSADIQPTLLPRNVIKGYAVVTMILNHIGHVFIPRDSFAKLFFVTLADAGGSMHVFNWLVGYNLTAVSRSSEAWLLGVFVFMQVFLSLPPPVTYETLLSISVIRWVLNTSYFRVDAVTGRCAWADAPIFLHAVLIVVIVFFENITGPEGLKMIPTNGLLFAACGRLFAVPKVNPCTRLLWVATSCMHTMLSMRYNWVLLLRDFPTYQYIYGTAFVLLTLIHTVVLNWKGSGDSKVTRWSPPALLSTIATFLSRYSLEIYLVHFVMFKIMYEFLL